MSYIIYHKVKKKKKNTVNHSQTFGTVKKKKEKKSDHRAPKTLRSRISEKERPRPNGAASSLRRPRERLVRCSKSPLRPRRLQFHDYISPPAKERRRGGQKGRRESVAASSKVRWLSYAHFDVTCASGLLEVRIARLVIASCLSVLRPAIIGSGFLLARR